MQSQPRIFWLGEVDSYSLPDLDILPIRSQPASQGVVAIGNGVNDRHMLARSTLGIAVIGPEGARRPYWGEPIWW